MNIDSLIIVGLLVLSYVSSSFGLWLLGKRSNYELPHDRRLRLREILDTFRESPSVVVYLTAAELRVCSSALMSWEASSDGSVSAAEARQLREKLRDSYSAAQADI